MSLSPDAIKWASDSLAAGRSLDFVASVLETKPRHVTAAVRDHNAGVVLDGPYVWRVSESDTSSARAKAERLFGGGDHEPEQLRRGPKPQPIEAPPERDRRRFLLAQRFAKHWDMIWYCLGRGMRGRTVRAIYGADCLVWTRGGGIDAEIE